MKSSFQSSILFRYVSQNRKKSCLESDILLIFDKKADTRLDSSDMSNMDKIAFRVSLIIAFVLKFIEAVVKNDGTPSMKRKIDFKSHQLHEKTPADQDPMDPVTRPIPHVSGAEQCTGQALYIDDLPRWVFKLTTSRNQFFIILV